MISNLSANISRRESLDNSLSVSIISESGVRLSVDNILSTVLLSEVSNRVVIIIHYHHQF